VLNSQRGKMRIRCQTPGGSDGFERTPENLRVLLTGVRDLRLGMPEPVVGRNSEAYCAISC